MMLFLGGRALRMLKAFNIKLQELGSEWDRVNKEMRSERHIETRDRDPAMG